MNMLDVLISPWNLLDRSTEASRVSILSTMYQISASGKKSFSCSEPLETISISRSLSKYRITIKKRFPVWQWAPQKYWRRVQFYIPSKWWKLDLPIFCFLHILQNSVLHSYLRRLRLWSRPSLLFLCPCTVRYLRTYCSLQVRAVDNLWIRLVIA